jgi:hypothetical protein
MVDWQITAKAIYCDAVDDDVVIMVFPDGSLKCTGYPKYSNPQNPETQTNLKNKSRLLNRSLKCEGPQDHRLTDYRDSILKS